MHVRQALVERTVYADWALETWYYLPVFDDERTWFSLLHRSIGFI